MLRASVCGRREANGRNNMLIWSSFPPGEERIKQVNHVVRSDPSETGTTYYANQLFVRSSPMLRWLPKEWHRASKATSSNPGQALGKPNLKKKKWKCCLYIYEAMHKVHTHLLTEESPGCQPLLLLCRKDTQESFLFRLPLFLLSFNAFYPRLPSTCKK